MTWLKKLRTYFVDQSTDFITTILMATLWGLIIRHLTGDIGGSVAFITMLGARPPRWLLIEEKCRRCDYHDIPQKKQMT